MFSDMTQNFQNTQKMASVRSEGANKQSFIKIKNIGDSTPENVTNLIPNLLGGQMKTPLAVAQALNQGSVIDIATIESSISQVQTDLNQNIILYKVLENAKNQMLQNEMTRFASTLSANIPTSKTCNIFAPKPMHAKIETSRIGRSHSMYVTNPLKAEISTGDKSNGSEKHSDEVSQSSSKKESEATNNNRKRMNVFRCPHKDRKHYAKNMCNNCYHKQGRNKKATVCPHTDRQNYAKGKCQNCYLNDYHKNKRKMKKEKASRVGEEVDRRISMETTNTDSVEEPKESLAGVKTT